MVSLTPADNAIDVDFNGDLVIVFSEPVLAGTGFYHDKNPFLAGYLKVFSVNARICYNN